MSNEIKPGAYIYWCGACRVGGNHDDNGYELSCSVCFLDESLNLEVLPVQELKLFPLPSASLLYPSMTKKYACDLTVVRWFLLDFGCRDECQTNWEIIVSFYKRKGGDEIVKWSLVLWFLVCFWVLFYRPGFPFIL